MKLKNKITGEIWDIGKVLTNGYPSYETLKQINEEWEDYEEPKDYWIIDTILHEIRSLPYKNNEEDKRYEQWLEELGLKFETKEEAEKAVEKLKAWKRLKDNGFRLDAVVDTFFCLDIYMCGEPYEAIKDDLKIVFGNEK